MTIFGQLVIGPPGAGKTTYCDGMAQFLQSLGRKVTLINLDPANENLPFEANVDISELVELSEVMQNFKLGPNGGLIYCMEFLEQNFDWLETKVREAKDTYLIIDCPGQVELYTHNNALKTVLSKLIKLDTRLCAVNLVDSHYCSDASKFISVCLTSLNMMLQLELPHVNVMSKVDLIEKYGKLRFDINFYTEVLDLSYLVQDIPDDPFAQKFKKLNQSLTELIENYGLVSFLPLSVKSKKLMLAVKNSVDKANGYCFGSAQERSMKNLMSSAIEGSEFEYMRTAEVRENFMDMEGKEDQKEMLGNDLDNVDITPGFQI